MTALSYANLWSKAKIFLDRALVARDGGRNDEYYLWAALSLELLGKASLARVHPSLIADPTHFPSLLAASSHQLTADVKSITAKTLFSRLGSIIPEFDDRMQRECNSIAERRNAELHSGLTPLMGVSERTWVPTFWKIVNVLVTNQARTLEDLLDAGEAQRIRKILHDAAELTRQTVLARIARCTLEIDQRYPANSAERREAASRAAARPLPSRYRDEADAFEDAECPACRMKGWLFGFLDHETIREEEIDTDGEWGPMFVEVVEKTYSTERFLCSECPLRLDGHDELEIAELPDTFVLVDEREPDYEPDYGND